MGKKDNVLAIWRLLHFRHSKLARVLPLYFVSGLSPERAIRAAAAGASLRKPVPVLHGNKTQARKGKAGLFLVKWFIKNITMHGHFRHGVTGSSFSWSVFLYLEFDKTNI